MSIESGQNPVIIESDIGKRIKAFRAKKSITLDQLASRTGFIKGYLPKVEKSRKSAPVSALGTIARALGASISTPVYLTSVSPGETKG